jgi:hypothetical protein
MDVNMPNRDGFFVPVRSEKNKALIKNYWLQTERLNKKPALNTLRAEYEPIYLP